jgi:hypothetical protein
MVLAMAIDDRTATQVEAERMVGWQVDTGGRRDLRCKHRTCRALLARVIGATLWLLGVWG